MELRTSKTWSPGGYGYQRVQVSALLSPLKRPVTWRTLREHALSAGFSALRNNFYAQPYAVQPREVVLERAAHCVACCTALDTNYS
jgi:hypothetical protein